MYAYLFRRLLATIPVMLVVALFVFALLQLSPGDPAAVIAGDTASPADIARIRHNLGLDNPILMQLGIWLWNVVRGDLGTSIHSGVPVLTLIGQRLEPTLALSASTMGLAMLLAVPLGIMAAWTVGPWIDRLVMIFAILGFSLPVFWLGFLWIYGFSIKLALLSVQGYVSVTQGFLPFVRHIMLPSLTLGMVYMALITRMTRASMLEVLREDYIRTAHAKGLKPRTVLLLHALKNASLPIVTIISVGVALLIGGVAVTESVFAIPGLGRLPVDAILHRDYPVIQGIILVFSGIYVLINLLVDMVYTCLEGTMITTAERETLYIPEPRSQPRRLGRFVRRNPTMVGGMVLFSLMVVMAVGAPYWGPLDPLELNPIERLRAPSTTHWFGTDMLGRDLYSRTIYGSRISLFVGLCVAALSMNIGLAIGLLSGYHRHVDAIVMRIMDGLMAIPAILLAIALMALVSASVQNVIIALTIPEIPRVVRVVRAVVLSLREQMYIEASRATGANLLHILGRHILPNTVAPPIVQGTYICASAVILEAYLSFLGAGTPPEVSSWGNIMAEGRTYVRIAFWILLFPGMCLATTVLAINLIGDGLRDTLDPKLARRM